jgi:hypothetical protein
MTSIKPLARLTLIVLTMASASVMSETVTVTPIATPHATCERLLNVTKNAQGKISDISFEIKSEETLSTEAVLILRELAQKLGTDIYSNRSWIQYEYFLDFSEPILEILRGVAMTFSGVGAGKSAKVLQDIDTLLYGAGSIEHKIQELDRLLESRPYLTRKATHEQKIKDTAETVAKCRAAVAACKVKLPSVMNDLNAEFVVLNKTKSIVMQELSLILKMKGILGEIFSEADAKEIEQSLTKKANDLQSGISTLGLLLEETSKLIATVQKVHGDAESLNEGVLQRAVIKAAKKGIDIRRVLESPVKVVPRLKPAAQSGEANPHSKIVALLQLEHLPPLIRFQKAFEVLNEIQTLSQEEFFELMDLITTTSQIEKAFCTDEDIVKDFLDRAKIPKRGLTSYKMGYRMLIMEDALTKVVPRGEMEWANWLSRFQLYWSKIKGFDIEGNTNSTSAWDATAAERFNAMATEVYQRFPPELLPQ